MHVLANNNKSRPKSHFWCQRHSPWPIDPDPTLSQFSLKALHVCNTVPLDIKVGIEEAALPQAGDLLRLLLCGVSRNCCKHHNSLSFLGHLQEFFRFGRVHSGKVNGWGGSSMLWQIPLFYVIIFL